MTSQNDVSSAGMRAIPFSGWVAVAFYAGAVVLIARGLTSSPEISIPAFASAAGCVAIGAVLGVLSRILRILRDIRDHMGAG